MHRESVAKIQNLWNVSQLASYLARSPELGLRPHAMQVFESHAAFQDRQVSAI